MLFNFKLLNLSYSNKLHDDYYKKRLKKDVSLSGNWSLLIDNWLCTLNYMIMKVAFLLLAGKT